MDRSKPIGNSEGTDDRGRLHVKVNNKDAEPVPVAIISEGPGSLFETLQFTGSATTTEVDLPATPGEDISQVIISCQTQFPAAKRLLFSLDNGATFFTMAPGSMVAWEPKDLKQIKIKANVSGVGYDVIINRRSS
jgi:hypothetical protein